MSGTTHRPGASHQSNKPFKGSGGHKSKGAIKRRVAGRVAASAGAHGAAKRAGVKATKTNAKANRKNAVRVARQSKRQEVLASRRIGSSASAPPKIVGMVPLSAHCDQLALRASILAACGVQDDPSSLSLPANVNLPAWKTRLALHVAPNDLFAILDLCKVVDLLIFLLPADSGVDYNGEDVLSAVRAQGLPPFVCVVQGMSGMPAKKAQAAAAYQSRYLSSQFPEAIKVMPADTPQELNLLFRQIANAPARTLRWRNRMAYMLADDVAWVDQAAGTLAVSGWLRGHAPLSPDQLVHIPGHGDFAITQLDAAARPGSAFTTLLPQRSEPLAPLADADPFAGEQSLITDEEMAQAAESAAVLQQRDSGAGKDSTTTDANAAWYNEMPEDEEDEEDEDDGEDMAPDLVPADDIGMGSEHDVNIAHDDGDGDDAMTEGGTGGPVDAAAMLADKQRLREKRLGDGDDDEHDAEKEDLLFPDEVQTPNDMRASERFARYRSLKSFRASPWDPKESLPPQYQRIVQFENFDAAQRRILASETGQLPGTYVRLVLANVEPTILDTWPLGHPFVLCGLHRFENKVSLVNFAIKRNVFYKRPVRSKDSLVFQYGFRRFSARPLFSEHVSGGNKFKFERFLHISRTSVASIYGPIQFGRAPVLMMRAGVTGRVDLVASGTLLDCNPDRLLIKRIILTGFPLRIHKAKARVRYMFFNPDDVRYFQKVELWTKYGRRGHIVEPVGMHGYMKTMFDGILTQQDTVCMSLYKRVFPKWPEQLPLEYPDALSGARASAWCVKPVDDIGDDDDAGAAAPAAMQS